MNVLVNVELALLWRLGATARILQEIEKSLYIHLTVQLYFMYILFTNYYLFYFAWSWSSQM